MPMETINCSEHLHLQARLYHRKCSKLVFADVISKQEISLFERKPGIGSRSSSVLISFLSAVPPPFGLFVVARPATGELGSGKKVEN